ncbi:CRISPR-associated protein Cas5 [Psychrilyobacter sp.]|uniref:CRISPR-associated protein Cas5 n=1 Tax=Psychrilyobacter sp. TaxID=2586924 RepID=UPI00301B133C
MKILKISLGGKFAHFGINGTNDKNNRYSYQHITGSSIKGILGAIMGYKGWGELEGKQQTPEFLEKLENISYGVVPKQFKFNSMLHTYNNTSGVNKNDKGSGTLQITEEILEDVSWDIYLRNLPQEVIDKILGNTSTYILSLGKKGFLMDKFKSQILDGEELLSNKVNSIIPANLNKEADDIFDLEEPVNESLNFLYSTNFYNRSEVFALTTSSLSKKIKVLNVEGKNIYMVGEI